MTKHWANIEVYGKCVDDFDVSPFEAMHAFHLRSKLEHVSHELTYEERMKLLSYDVRLINNAKEMSKHIGEVYDFSVSDEPLSQWWWHLDKVSNGKITFRLIPFTI
ncbi:hypothetical protein [Brevibacillus borstelensis]